MLANNCLPRRSSMDEQSFIDGQMHNILNARPLIIFFCDRNTKSDNDLFESMIEAFDECRIRDNNLTIG